jgi:hypothetical protein
MDIDNTKKLGQINDNITDFFKDLVTFVQKVWEYIEKFFTRYENVLWDGQNVTEAAASDSDA